MKQCSKEILPPSPNVCRPLVHFCIKEWQTFGDGGSTKLASSLVWLVAAELGKLFRGSNIGGFKNISLFGLGGKVLLDEGAWLGTWFNGMPNLRFSKGTCVADELDACWLT
jgi:hypothetical protein